MSHLGALITPYVDGELSPARAAEARVHLAGCDECRRALLMEQTARRRTQDSVRGMQASAELTARLLAMRSQTLPAGGAVGVRRHRAPFVLGGGAALVGLFVLSLFVLGTPREGQAPTALPGAVDTAADDEAISFRPVSADTSSTSGWVVPATLSVADVGMLDDGATATLDLTVIVPEGQVRLLEQTGRLTDTVDGTAATTIGGHVVHEVDGWYVLESGTCVIAVYADSPEAAEAVISELPAPASDGVIDRIMAGWQVLVD